MLIEVDSEKEAVLHEAVARGLASSPEDFVLSLIERHAAEQAEQAEVESILLQAKRETPLRFAGRRDAEADFRSFLDGGSQERRA